MAEKMNPHRKLWRTRICFDVSEEQYRRIHDLTEWGEVGKIYQALTAVLLNSLERDNKGTRLLLLSKHLTLKDFMEKEDLHAEPSGMDDEPSSQLLGFGVPGEDEDNPGS